VASLKSVSADIEQQEAPVAPDKVQVRLHLRLIRVRGVLVDTIDELVVAVAATRST
jgi:hypothetical protein